jgi:hypothetical protein
MLKMPDAQSATVVDRKSAATVTLFGLAACMILANVGAVRQPDLPRADAAAVRIVDPAFCKEQIWPYIDARCLKRVDTADRPAADAQGAAPQTSTADASTRAVGADANSPLATAANGAATTSVPTANVAGMPAPSPAGTAAPPIIPPTAPAIGNAGASGATEIRRDAANVPADVSDDPRLTDVSQPHASRHGRHHSRSFFGFRF